MVEAASIEAELLAFLRREVFAPELDITPETDLVSAGFDSMSLVRVLVFVEQTYQLWIPESEITGESLKNLRTLAATVARLLQAR
ncbi:MAG TPA: acyl carrier protein [Methylomirabilota bacterium]|nr:acyl carrier protein [Methylomirabilota bacterium]